MTVTVCPRVVVGRAGVGETVGSAAPQRKLPNTKSNKMFFLVLGAFLAPLGPPISSQRPTLYTPRGIPVHLFFSLAGSRPGHGPDGAIRPRCRPTSKRKCGSNTATAREPREAHHQKLGLLRGAGP